MNRRQFGLDISGLLLCAAFPAGAGEAVAATPSTKPNAAWKALLPADRYRVLFEDDTERPFSSPLNDEKGGGTFICAACFLPLFDSAHKFDSGTGWPSFWDALPGAVATRPDLTLLMRRTEYHCSRCGGHQGHVFDDGPAPTHLRYCNNGLALQYVPSGEPLPPARAADEQTAVFAGGCFWGVQAVFQHLRGVKSATSGYSGGHAGEASYAAVSRGDTGHAESVRVVYDPSQIYYGQLLRVFFAVAHDPTQLNRQGPDAGTQYRSAIFYVNDEQRRTAAAYVDQLERAKPFAQPIVTQIVPLAAFYPAESYHQNYVAQHPHAIYVVVNDFPKLERLRTAFPSIYRANAPKESP